MTKPNFMPTKPSHYLAESFLRGNQFRFLNKGKILRKLENKLHRVVSQKYSTLKLQSNSGDICYRNVYVMLDLITLQEKKKQFLTHSNHTREICETDKPLKYQ